MPVHVTTDFTMWLITAILVMAFTIIWYFTRLTISRILEELQSMNKTMKDMATNIARAEERATSTADKLNEVIKRLNDHSLRIRNIERTQDACNHCPDKSNEG